MKALFVAWNDPILHCWAPVGRLTRAGTYYHFVYTRGAKEIRGFMPFGRMTKLDTEYVSTDLFPLFANRVLPRTRPEYRDYLRWLGLTETQHDELEELARTGGLRATDTLELIPCPEPTAANRYEVFFFSRGLRHLHEENQQRAARLTAGERLYLMQDLQNTHDPMALLLRTGNPVTLVGYAPRYYSAEFTTLIGLVGQEAVTVTVERVNLDAPLQYRVLCKLSAPWPAQFLPCVSGAYEPLGKAAPSCH